MSSQIDPWDTLEQEQEPQELASNYLSKPDKEKDAWDAVDFKESFGKSFLRKIFQIPKGLLQVSGYGLLTNLMNLISAGEALDEEEIDRIRAISERENIPFDEEQFRENYQQALNTFPTINNLASGIEKYTGLPLEAKGEIDKFIEFASSASKLSPEGFTFRGMNIGLPKPVLGTGVAATAEGLKQIPGMPDWLADIGAFAILKEPRAGSPSLSLGKTKPSGIPERGFEKLKEPRQISEKKFESINEKLESDFKNTFDKIVAESPVGETFENLKNNPLFKEETKELLNEAQSIADSMPGMYPSKNLKKEYADIGAKRPKGLALSEYDKNYVKQMKEGIDSILGENFSPGQLVEHYRKNNTSLSEYFEPGASKALNRAKRDALLDQNRAIVNFMEKNFPESELVPVFKDGNARWSKIMDAEAVESFVDNIFSKEKIDFKNIRKYFDKEGYTRIFKRALGEKGEQEFEQLLKDMLGSERPYKMLKLAKQKGFNELFQTASAYLINPSLGKGLTFFKAGKKGMKFLFDSLLDKPQLGFTLKKGIDNLKKGKFEQATKDFKVLKGELEVPKKKAPESKIAESETIEITPDKITPQVIEPLQIESQKTDPKLLSAPKFNFEIVKGKRGYGSKEMMINNSKGKMVGGLEWSAGGDDIYIEGIWSIQPGAAQKALKELIKISGDRNVYITPLTEDGAKFASKLLGRKIEPILKESEDIISTISRKKEFPLLTNKDKEKILASPNFPKPFPISNMKEKKGKTPASESKGLEYTKEDFPTKKEAEIYRDHLEKTLQHAPEVHKKSLEKDIQNMNKLISTFPPEESFLLTPRPQRKKVKLPLRGKEGIEEMADTYADLFAIVKIKGGYKVSHIPSGGTLREFDSKLQAKEFMKSLFEEDFIDMELAREKDFEKAALMIKDTSRLMQKAHEIKGYKE